MQPEQPANQKEYIPALDGLRGLAVLIVVIWHYLIFTHPYFPGWAGVDLFFVLSGYLITGKLLQAKGKKHYFSQFYRNRALRIFPLYYSLVIPFLTAVRLFVQSKNLAAMDFYIHHWKSFLFFTFNWTIIFYGFPGDVSLVPLWSLSVEQQFYLIWPLFILLSPSPKFRIRALSLLILLVLLTRSATYLLAPAPDYHVYYNTFFRLDSFCAGSLLYQLHSTGMKISIMRIRRTALILLTILISGIFIMKNASPHNTFFSTAGYTLNALLFTCLIHLAVQPDSSWVTRLTNKRFLTFCGKISYCLYLVHVPVLIAIGTRVYYFGLARWPEKAFALQWVSAGVSLLISFLISMISYHYFEPYFLRLKRSLVASAPMEK
jgi:peptidoglycan/LPS O-acetylase OafA/YrhL